MNKGVKPLRYRMEDTDSAPSTVMDSSSSVSSRRKSSSSSRGSKGTVRSQQLRIAVEANQAIDNLKSAQLQREKDLALMKAQEQSLIMKIRRLAHQGEDSSISPEERASLMVRRAGLENDLEELTAD